MRITSIVKTVKSRQFPSESAVTNKVKTQKYPDFLCWACHNGRQLHRVTARLGSVRIVNELPEDLILRPLGRNRAQPTIQCATASATRLNR